jgi:hypothetical protein
MSESRFNSSRLPHGYHLRHVDANADHHGYFDPAEGPVPNPGMGISGYVVSDHMHVSRGSWDAEALAGFEGTVRFTLSLRMKGKDHPVQWAIATKNPAERQAIEAQVSISNELRKAR